MSWLQPFDYLSIMFLVSYCLMFGVESVNIVMWVSFGVYFVTLPIRWVMLWRGRKYEKSIEFLRHRVSVLKKELGRME